MWSEIGGQEGPRRAQATRLSEWNDSRRQFIGTCDILGSLIRRVSSGRDAGAAYRTKAHQISEGQCMQAEHCVLRGAGKRSYRQNFLTGLVLLKALYSAIFYAEHMRTNPFLSFALPFSSSSRSLFFQIGPIHSNFLQANVYLDDNGSRRHGSSYGVNLAR
jgi:hypothetical protein